MNRRKFLGSLGLGAAAIVAAPSLLAQEEIKPITKIPEGLTKPGQYGSTFKISLSRDMFNPGDVLATDPEYGQQWIICEKQHPEYNCKLVSNNPIEFISPKELEKGKQVVKIEPAGGEYATNVSTVAFSDKTVLEFNGLDGSFYYDVEPERCYIV